VVAAGDKETGRPMQQQLTQQLLFLLTVVMGHAHQRLVALGAQRLLRGLEQINEQGVGQQRDQHRHVVAVARGQSARGRIGHIGQALGGRLHPLDQLGRHRPLAAERP
jgi:hypothetical protein